MKEDKFPKLDKKMINEWMDTLLRDPLHRMIDGKSFRVDMYETDRDCILQAELPGFDRDQIDIELLHSAVRITARHHESLEENNEYEQYYRRERSFESLERVIPVPYDIDESGTKARYDNGLLTVTMPKLGGSRRKRTIDIDS